MKREMIKLAQRGLNVTIGYSPKASDIRLLEGCYTSVRFFVDRHSNIEYSVKLDLARGIITVEMEDMDNGNIVEFSSRVDY